MDTFFSRKTHPRQLHPTLIHILQLAARPRLPLLHDDHPARETVRFELKRPPTPRAQNERVGWNEQKQEGAALRNKARVSLVENKSCTSQQKFRERQARPSLLMKILGTHI